MAPEPATEVVLIEGLLGELGRSESNSNLAWLGVEGARRESESQAAIGSFLRSRKSSKRALRRRHRRAMLADGRIVKTGDKNLALELEQTGNTGVEEVVTA